MVGDPDYIEPHHTQSIPHPKSFAQLLPSKSINTITIIGLIHWTFYLLAISPSRRISLTYSVEEMRSGILAPEIPWSCTDGQRPVDVRRDEAGGRETAEPSGGSLSACSEQWALLHPYCQPVQIHTWFFALEKQARRNILFLNNEIKQRKNSVVSQLRRQHLCAMCKSVWTGSSTHFCHLPLAHALPFLPALTFQCSLGSYWQMTLAYSCFATNFHLVPHFTYFARVVIMALNGIECAF